MQSPGSQHRSAFAAFARAHAINHYGPDIEVKRLVQETLWPWPWRMLASSSLFKLRKTVKRTQRVGGKRDLLRDG